MTPYIEPLRDVPVTWLIQVCDILCGVTHSFAICVCRDTFMTDTCVTWRIYVTWRIHMRDLIYYSFRFVKIHPIFSRLIQLSHFSFHLPRLASRMSLDLLIMSSYVCHDSFTCVTWVTDVWHDSFICVTWLFHICDMTPSYVWHDSFICVTWLLLYMCDMIPSYVW